MEFSRFFSKTEEPKLPTGLGQEELSKNRETLPVAEVTNEVTWKNEAFPDLPFKLSVGESSSLGVFVTNDKSQATSRVEVSGGHNRSGLLARVLFADRDGIKYRDVDLKGIGANQYDNEKGQYVSRSIDSDTVDQLRTYGGLNRLAAENDVKMSELFINLGIKTHRVIAIIRLGGVIDRDEHKISIDEAREKGMIFPGHDLVIEVRAFGIHSRLNDADDLIIEDGRRFMAQELGRPENKFDKEAYSYSLTATIARNIGLMHGAGFVHGALTGGNITMDGRIVDLDSVKIVEGLSRGHQVSLDDKRLAWHDMRGLFFKMGLPAKTVQKLFKEFEGIYDKEYLDQEKKRDIGKISP